MDYPPGTYPSQLITFLASMSAILGLLLLGLYFFTYKHVNRVILIILKNFFNWLNMMIKRLLARSIEESEKVENDFKPKE